MSHLCCTTLYNNQYFFTYYFNQFFFYNTTTFCLAVLNIPDFILSTYLGNIEAGPGSCGPGTNTNLLFSTKVGNSVINSVKL